MFGSVGMRKHGMCRAVERFESNIDPGDPGDRRSDASARNESDDEEREGFIFFVCFYGIVVKLFAF